MDKASCQIIVLIHSRVIWQSAVRVVAWSEMLRHNEERLFSVSVKSVAKVIPGEDFRRTEI